jgi:hypothetical protein
VKHRQQTAYRQTAYRQHTDSTGEEVKIIICFSLFSLLFICKKKMSSSTNSSSALTGMNDIPISFYQNLITNPSAGAQEPSAEYQIEPLPTAAVNNIKTSYALRDEQRDFDSSFKRLEDKFTELQTVMNIVKELNENNKQGGSDNMVRRCEEYNRQMKNMNEEYQFLREFLCVYSQYSGFNIIAEFNRWTEWKRNGTSPFVFSCPSSSNDAHKQ